jgi:hypothetical protein
LQYLTSLTSVQLEPFQLSVTPVIGGINPPVAQKAAVETSPDPDH